MKTRPEGELVPNYVIRWRSKITDKTGGGEARFWKVEAANIATRLDYDHPDLEHWILLT